jgi:hypothetical protein
MLLHAIMMHQGWFMALASSSTSLWWFVGKTIRARCHIVQLEARAGTTSALRIPAE